MGFFSFLRKQENRSINHVENPCATGCTVSNLWNGAVKGEALSLAPLFAGINMISNSCAIMDWYACNAEGEALKPTHYLNHLFDRARITRFTAVKNAIKDVLLTGNGYMYIERDAETGRPVTLRYLPANQVQVYINQFTDEVYYTSTKVQKGYINEMDMLHYKIHTRDGILGIGIPQLAYETVDLATSTERATTNYMKSGGAVYGIISPNETRPDVPTTQKQIENLRRSWEDAKERNGGTSTIILPADVKFQQLSANARDAALIDTRLYNLQEIARWLNISPILLGDLSHSQYGNMEEAQAEFVQHTLQPYITMMEQENNRKLIMPSKIGQEMIDIDENDILATNKLNQASYLSSLVEKGLLTVNEAREELNYPAVDGGDTLKVYYSDANQNSLAGDEDKNTDENEDEQ